MELQLSGMASGFDWLTMVERLTDVARAPQNQLRVEQDRLDARNQAYGTLITELGVLQNKVDAIQQASLFGQRQVALSAFGVASAIAGTDTPLGAYTFAFSQLATSAAQLGATNVGAALNPTNDVSALVLDNAAFATTVTAGAFTVNGETVTIATSDTVQQVFDKISAATAGAVTGSYDAATDKITLSSASAVSVGSAADTSNFLQAAKLASNGTGTIVSSAALGVVRVGSVLAAANLATAISDGGSGAGSFKINGVSISFNASADTLADVVDRINESSAGVTAVYDSLNDRVTLTNKSTGNLGIALQDVTGNFLTATKLLAAAGGTLQSGQDLEYTVNDGATLTSHSNIVTSESHGIAGLTVTALQGATVTTTPPDGNTGFPQLVEFFGTSTGSATRMRTVPDHAFQTGYAVRFASTGTLPSMLDANTTYYVRRVDVDDISIHLTASAAASGANPINFGANPPYTGEAYVMQVDPLASAEDTTTPGTVTISITGDTGPVKTTIQEFIDQYNKVQSLIDSQTASSTDKDGKVTAGVLAGDLEVAAVASKLRSSVFSQINGLGGTVNRLSQLGYETNGNDDTLSLHNSETLDSLLTTSLTSIKAFFTDPTNGLAVTLSASIEALAGDEGSLVDHQTLLTEQSSGINDQVAELEKIVQANRERMIGSFIAMEKAQAQFNQQLQFLLQRLNLNS